jgi:hypothetical protein
MEANLELFEQYFNEVYFDGAAALYLTTQPALYRFEYERFCASHGLTVNTFSHA